MSEVVVPTGLLEFMWSSGATFSTAASASRATPPRLWETVVEDGDVLLSVTDGVSDNLTFSEVRYLVRDGRDNPDRTAPGWSSLLRRQLPRRPSPRAKMDDITAVVAPVGRDAPNLRRTNDGSAMMTGFEMGNEGIDPAEVVLTDNSSGASANAKRREELEAEAEEEN